MGEADARRIVETTVEGFGGVDIPINNAGFGRFAPLLETSADDMEAVWRTNVLGAFLVGRARDAWSSRARGRSSTWPRRRPAGIPARLGLRLEQVRSPRDDRVPR